MSSYGPTTLVVGLGTMIGCSGGLPPFIPAISCTWLWKLPPMTISDEGLGTGAPSRTDSLATRAAATVVTYFSISERIVGRRPSTPFIPTPSSPRSASQLPSGTTSLSTSTPGCSAPGGPKLTSFMPHLLGFGTLESVLAKKVEVAALVGLHDVSLMQPPISTVRCTLTGFGGVLGAAIAQLVVVDEQVQSTCVDVEGDEVAVAHE